MPARGSRTRTWRGDAGRGTAAQPSSARARARALVFLRARALVHGHPLVDSISRGLDLLRRVPRLEGAGMSRAPSGAAARTRRSDHATRARRSKSNPPSSSCARSAARAARTARRAPRSPPCRACDASACREATSRRDRTGPASTDGRICWRSSRRLELTQQLVRKTWSPSRTASRAAKSLPSRVGPRHRVCRRAAGIRATCPRPTALRQARKGSLGERFEIFLTATAARLQRGRATARRRPPARFRIVDGLVGLHQKSRAGR